ncbi:hypothetical protein JW948_02935 [bacterium]|nr:hypothetical protein [bacterium]
MKKIAVLLLLICSLRASASLNETLPPWHWACPLIADMQTAGLLQDLNQLNQPYTRGDVAVALIDIGSLIKNSKVLLSKGQLERYAKLVREFAPEIQALKTEDDAERLELGGHLIGDMQKDSDKDMKFRGIYRTRIHVPAGRSVTMFNAMNFDQNLVHDDLYMGKKWRGIVGYTEQAYVSARFGRFGMKFGRDFLKWGAGRSGTLIFSDAARPMDHFLGSVTAGPFTFSYLLSRLDDWPLTPRLADSLGGTRARRYVSAHRLDARFFDGRLQCAVTEAVIYGGVNRSPEFSYLNPFIFYHGSQMNEANTANTFGSIDVLWAPANRVQLYASLMIDDIQIEETGPGDLEPDEIGYIIGGRWTPNGSTLISAEYARVTNRTYKTINPWETFMHRNGPLGHPLGNDFDLWQVEAGQWFGPSVRASLSFTQIRKGEGDLFSPFDMPWMDYTVEEGYSEPFPTGIVEKRQIIGLQLRYDASAHWGLHGLFQSTVFDQYQHVENRDETQTFWKLGLWLDGDVIFRLQ